MGEPIGAYLHRDIRKATVTVDLEDEDGDVREVPFQFEGETFEDGEHCKLYLRKSAAEDLQRLGKIPQLDKTYGETGGRYVYRFHKEEVEVDGEDSIWFDERV